MKFWNEKGDKRRIYSNNILGIKMYNSLGYKQEVAKLIEQNKEIEKEVKINVYAKELFAKVVLDSGT